MIRPSVPLRRRRVYTPTHLNADPSGALYSYVQIVALPSYLRFLLEPLPPELGLAVAPVVLGCGLPGAAADAVIAGGELAAAAAATSSCLRLSASAMVSMR